MENITTIHSAMLDAAYQQPYYQIPQQLFKYLRTLSISDTCRAVYQVHWGLSVICRTMVTTIPITQVAHILNVSVRTVRRCYTTLIEQGLMQRQAKTNHYGGQISSETILLLPDEGLAQLVIQAPRASQRRCDQQEETHPSLAADPESIAALPVQTTEEPNQVIEQPSMPAANAAVMNAGDLVEIVQSIPTDEDTSIMSELDHKELHHLEQRIKQLNEQFVAASTQRDLLTLRQVGQQIDQLKQERERISNPQQNRRQTLKSPHSLASSRPDVTPKGVPETKQKPIKSQRQPRRLTEAFKRRIESEVNKIKRLSSPPQVVTEVIYSLERGVQSDRDPYHGLNAALNLLRKNLWRTPYGFIQP